MKIAAMAFAALLAAVADAEVHVTFDKPERYSDLGQELSGAPHPAAREPGVREADAGGVVQEDFRGA